MSEKDEPQVDEQEFEAEEPRADHPADVVSGGDAPDALKDGREDDEASRIDARLESLKNERDDFFERLQRVSADYQNFQRRAEQNLADSINFARGDLLRSFIPVLDHFDNALGHEPKSEDGRALCDGVRIVRDELLKVLENAGVSRIDVQAGQPFDPNIHEAMLRQPAKGIEPNHVTMVMQPGYTFRNRTLRPAKVAVAPQE